MYINISLNTVILPDKPKMVKVQSIKVLFNIQAYNNNVHICVNMNNERAGRERKLCLKSGSNCNQRVARFTLS